LPCPAGGRQGLAVEVAIPSHPPPEAHQKTKLKARSVIASGLSMQRE